MNWENQRFWVVVEGRPQGPFKLDELRERKLQQTDFVRSESMAEFKELVDLESLCLALGLKPERAVPQYFVTMDNRLLAVAMDYFIAYFVYALIAFFYLIFTSPSENRAMLILSGTPLVLVIKFLGSVFFEASSWHATPGKKMIGAVVLKPNGEPIGLGTSFIRNLAKILGVLSLGIGFFVGFFNKRQQAWHDRIANTCVAKSRLI